MQQFVVAFWDALPPSHPLCSLILHLSLAPSLLKYLTGVREYSVFLAFNVKLGRGGFFCFLFFGFFFTLAAVVFRHREASWLVGGRGSDNGEHVCASGRT